MVKLKCELATGYGAEDLTELVCPSRVMHQSIDRERGSLGRLSRGGLVCPFQLSLQLEPAHLQHLGGAIQNLPT